MADDQQITVIGNLTADPELRFLQNGSPVVNFTVARTPRRFDKQSNEWKDGETQFYPCSMWGTGAENIAETFRKGMRVIVEGLLVYRSWESEGKRNGRFEVKVNEAGPSLKRMTVNGDPTQVFRKADGKQPGQAGGQPQQPQARPESAGQSNDPWSTNPSSDEPPF